MLRTTEVGDLAWPQLSRQREFGPCHQPVREVVTLGVVDDAFGWDRLQLLFQFVQVFGAPHFALVGHPEHEVAESEMVGQNAAQIPQQRG